MRLRAAGAADAPEDGHILASVDGTAVPFGETYDHPILGPERVDPGAVEDVGVLVGRALTDNHKDAVGVIRAAAVTSTGVEISGDVLDTVRGRDVNVLLRHGPTTGLSIGFTGLAGDYDDDGVWVWTRIDVREVALTHMPAYLTASITEVRSRTMHPTPTLTEVSDDGLAARVGLIEERAASMLEQLQGLFDRSASGARPPAVQRVLDLQARHTSAQAWAQHERTAPAEERAGIPVHTRALATIVTADLNGLDTGWATDLVSVIDRGRPFLNALGTQSLPPVGMKTHYAKVMAANGTSELTASDLVGVQSAELGEITSAKWTIKPGEAAVATIAGGSKLSYQDLDRLGAEFQRDYWEVMAWAWAAVSEATAVTAVTSAAGLPAVLTYTKGDPTTYGDVLRTGISNVQTATGANPTVCVVGQTVWGKIASAKDTTKRPLYPMFGPSNANGVATIDTLIVEGVPHIKSPYIAADDVVLTNEIAVKVLEDSVRQITAEDVSHLGRDAGLYGYQSVQVRKTAGVVRIREAAA